MAQEVDFDDVIIISPIKQQKETPSASDLMDKTRACIEICPTHTMTDYTRRKRVTIMECTDMSNVRSNVPRVPLMRSGDVNKSRSTFSVSGKTSTSHGSVTPRSMNTGSNGHATPKTVSGATTPKVQILSAATTPKHTPVLSPSNAITFAPLT